jgi:hypothetical protein
MRRGVDMSAEPFTMQFDIGTIKHLGLQMYSTLPPVIGELISNSWDGEATRVEVTIPEGALDNSSVIVVSDNGIGMSDDDVREGFLRVGRDRRKDEETDTTRQLKIAQKRPLMGRKGIGKFSGFGIATAIEIETVRDGVTSRFIMDYAKLEAAAKAREISFEPLPPTGSVDVGTRVTLRNITKFRTRSISLTALRRSIARRFSVIGSTYTFEVVINGSPITPEERDLHRLLDKRSDGSPYLWEYDNVEIKPDTGWTVSGWIGAVKRTVPLEDGVQRGIAILARGKLVQEPFTFDAVVGQQFALSYLIGELTAEFVDGVEDTIATTRNTLVWDTEANSALKVWGAKEVNRIAREWADKRAEDNEKELQKNPLYTRFLEESEKTSNPKAKKIADKLVRDVIKKDIISGDEHQEDVVQLCIDFLEFDEFWDLAEQLSEADIHDPGKVASLFRDWEIIEAREMAKVTRGRIQTIEKLQRLIETNALEVPTLHNFLKEFPWVLDPRWTLVADEQYFSGLLRDHFPESDEVPEADRRIDFLCIREGDQLVVVEIKRPQSKASEKELDQIREYVYFLRDIVEKTTDPDFNFRDVTGYLFCGSLVDTVNVRQGVKGLERDRIYVRRYSDLLRLVENSHKEFLERYNALQAARRARGSS